MSTERSADSMAEGTGFNCTHDLCVVCLSDAMCLADKDEWEKAVEVEHSKFEKYKVWEPVAKSDIPSNGKVMTST